MADPVTIGAGPDSLVLRVNQDAYLGDSQYVVRVDGAQIGGALTAQASRVAGELDTVIVRGDWGAGAHAVEIQHLNDLWQPGIGDRNLYVPSASYNGAEIAAPGDIWLQGGTAFTDAGAPTALVAAPGAPVAPAPGYRVVLSDDFSAGYNMANWGPPFPLPWPPGFSSNGAWLWSGDETNVRGGEMQVTMTRHDGAPWTAGGFNSFRAGVSIHYGTVEFDARMEEAQGTLAAILMWPASDKWTSEIDILETPKDQVLHTLHWQDGSGHQYSPIWHSSFDETQWNHYKMTWLPGLVRIEVNGQVHAEWTSNVPNEPMGFGAMGYVAAPGEGWAGGAPDATTPGVVTLHLDNVVMSQWTGIAG